MTARFADFLDRHAEHGLTTIPTFIVGHMSGENWDPAWRNGRHLYNDVWLVGRFIRTPLAASGKLSRLSITGMRPGRVPVNPGRVPRTPRTWTFSNLTGIVIVNRRQ